MKKFVFSAVFVLVCGVPALLQANTITLNLSVVVDGRDYLHFHGTTLQWEQLAPYYDPGPTTITAAINGVPVATSLLFNNGIWVDPWQGTQNVGLIPGPYTLPGSLALPAMAQIVGLAYTVSSGGGTVTVLNQPTLLDSYLLKLDANDNPEGGTHLYDITLTYDDGDPAVPEPASLLLLGSGMAGLGSFIRRRNKK